MVSSRLDQLRAGHTVTRANRLDAWQWKHSRHFNALTPWIINFICKFLGRSVRGSKIGPWRSNRCGLAPANAWQIDRLQIYVDLSLAGGLRIINFICMFIRRSGKTDLIVDASGRCTHSRSIFTAARRPESIKRVSPWEPSTAGDLPSAKYRERRVEAKDSKDNREQVTALSRATAFTVLRPILPWSSGIGVRDSRFPYLKRYLDG